MASVAAQDGIKRLVATPHINQKNVAGSRQQILKKVGDLNLCLGVQGIKLAILPGGEYSLEMDLPERLAAGQLLTLNDSGRYLLVEFPAAVVPENSGVIFQALLSQGCTPIIAHPERNRHLLQEPELLERFVARGMLSQVTSGSLTGMYGKEIQEYAYKFIQKGLVQLVASDAHSANIRPPLLSPAFAEIEKRWGKELAMVLFCRNPWRVTM